MDHVKTEKVEKTLESEGMNVIRDVDEFLNTPVHYDPFKRNKVPFALRIRGSILVDMIPTLVLVAVWSSIVVYVHMYHHSLAVDGVLITVTGLVTSLVLGFRVNSAYERYSEAMNYWTQLSKVIRCTVREIWWSIPEIQTASGDQHYTHEELDRFVKEELLTKTTAVRILLGFVYALKHHLRGEFGTDWDDMKDLVGFLPTYARLRSELERNHVHKRRTSSALGSLQTSFLRKTKLHPRRASNKLIKATIAHGNLPLELLSFFSSYVDILDKERKITPTLRNFFLDQTIQLQGILAGCEKVLRTPLPLAFNISIAQITWVFILLLPFQLVGSFEWATIPACTAAAYMLLGLSRLSFEIENPFGTDNNDLPLDRMCEVITTDADVICAHKMSSGNMSSKKWMFDVGNKPLEPVVKSGIQECLEVMTVEEIREALRLKVERVKGTGSVRDTATVGGGLGGNGAASVPIHDNSGTGIGGITQLPV